MKNSQNYTKCQCTLRYNLLSVNYNDRNRMTRVAIVNPTTGEVFCGTTRRHPKDEFSLETGFEIALDRAILSYMRTVIDDDIKALSR